MNVLRVASNVALLAAAVAGYLRWGRPRVLNWGARPDEVGRTLVGDGVLPQANLQTTRAISIETTSAHIWPWLVQMGPRPRAGAYTYDWIERLLGIDIENADHILPQYQHLQEGDFMGLNDKGQGLRVVKVEPERSLVLEWVPAGNTWEFCLFPEGGRTRLLSRNRIAGSGPFFWLGMVGFMEWASLIMERKMLLGIKQRAERLALSRVGAAST